MATFGRQFSSEPVLTMSPQPSHQSPFSMAGFSHQHAAPSMSIGATPMAASPSVLQRNPPSMSRKRSRDEASANLEPDVAPAPPADPEDGWVYGPGMTLIKPDQGYSTDAGTQSGTWVEERKAQDDDARQKQEEAQRPVIRSHKSLRIDRGNDAAPSTTALPTNGVNDTSVIGSVASPNALPVIDNFTVQLGIGWTRISEEEHLQAAARGWARFIENHYPITNAHVRLESKGLQSYLVESNEGFFLFAENLRQGRLVSSHIVGAMQNLRRSPPAFESPNTLYPSEPAKTATEMLQAQVAVADTEMGMD